MLKENRHILELKNQVVDSYDEDDDIFETEKSFSGFFNTFVSQWCVKNVFKLAFRFHVFPEIPEMLEVTHLKNLISNTTVKLKRCKLKYFGQTAHSICGEM